MEVVVTTGAISGAKLQSYRHHQQTDTQLFTGRMPFLSPNQQCQSTEGKISHFADLPIPSSPGGLPTLSLTTNSSWLPWGRVAMPLISPLMPVPLGHHIRTCLLLASTHNQATSGLQNNKSMTDSNSIPTFHRTRWLDSLKHSTVL